MAHPSYLHDVVYLLLATVVAVPLFKRLGLGSVLGFLAGGILIGPWGLSFIDDVENIMHLAELGVVLLLFVIGLELLPQRLWEMRAQIGGYGFSQMFGSTLLLLAFCYFLGLRGASALIVAIGLSMSSTAFALQMLAEKNQLSSPPGQKAFSILIFQDIAVIPVLAILPVLGAADTLDDTIGFWSLAKKLAAVVALVVAGHFLLRPFFRYVATIKNQEVFTASALLIVLGVALLMESIGISMALGAFIAGVLLADSEYRHELEANIEPFKGLLMGLFFLSVGMSINIGMFFESFNVIIATTLCVVIIKLMVLLLIGRVGGLKKSGSRSLAIMLSQTGEFAFVLFTLGRSQGLIGAQLFELLMVVVAFSMATTPILFTLNERYGVHLEGADEETAPHDQNDSSQVVIAGF